MGIRILVPRLRRRREAGKPARFLWLCAGLALWAFAYTLFGADGLAGVVRTRQRAAQLEARIEQVRTQNLQLRERIRALRNDPEAIEREARERLFLARPGETVYLLPVRPQAPAADTPRQDAPPPDDVSQR